MQLKDKTILITAVGQGMGRAAALACAAEGAKVIATDRDTDLLGDFAEPGIETAVLDVADPQAVAQTAKAVGPPDGLFNCAGVVHQGAILDLSDEAWQASLDVTMASMASSIKGFPKRAAYGATKAAVIDLTKPIAVDFVHWGLRCNALCPGTVDAPSLRRRIAAAADPIQAEKDFIARQPMGRLATVDDTTPIIDYLLLDDSGYVTG